MEQEFGLNDDLNLKALITHITKFVKAHHITDGPDSTIKFLKMLLSGINGIDVSHYPFLKESIVPRKRGKNKNAASEYTPPTVSDLQKCLSGNVTLDKLEQFSKLVLVGAYDTLFQNNLRPLVLQIEQRNLGIELHDELVKLASPGYFSKDVLDKLNADKHDLSSFLLQLLHHGFNSLENIPSYYARRVYEQAVTFDYDHPARYELMKEAADSGEIPQACIEYANYLAKRDNYDTPLSENEIPLFEEALKYFLKAHAYAPALWNIGFILEKFNIPKKTVSQINQELRINSKLKDLDPDLVSRELEIVNPVHNSKNAHAVALAYKIHFYLAYRKESFSKSFNSLGNMLASEKVVLDSSATNLTPKLLVDRYRNLAANEQDLSAITNISSSWMNRLRSGDDSLEENPKMNHFLKISAKMKMRRGLYNLAVAEHYSLTVNASRKGETISDLDQKKVSEMLLDALKVKQDDKRAGELFYLLGVLEPLQNESRRTEYFTKAAEKGYPDAIYEVSLIQYLQNRQDIFVLKKILTDLQNAVNQMTSKKTDAQDLIKQIENILLNNKT